MQLLDQSQLLNMDLSLTAGVQFPGTSRTATTSQLHTSTQEHSTEGVYCVCTMPSTENGYCVGIRSSHQASRALCCVPLKNDLQATTHLLLTRPSCV